MRSLLNICMVQKVIDNRLLYAEYIELSNRKLQLQFNKSLPHYENNIMEYVYNEFKNMAILPSWDCNDSKQICSQLKISLQEIMRITRFGGVYVIIAPKWFIEKHKILSYNFVMIESTLPDDLIIATMYGTLEYSSGIIFGSSDGQYIDCMYHKKNYQDFYKVFKI